jgi:hypothetical protein
VETFPELERASAAASTAERTPTRYPVVLVALWVEIASWSWVVALEKSSWRAWRVGIGAPAVGGGEVEVLRALVLMVSRSSWSAELVGSLGSAVEAARRSCRRASAAK